MTYEQQGNIPEQKEWSHFIDCETIDTSPTTIEISPNKDEIRALCKRIGICTIQSLVAKLELKRNKISKVIEVSGTIKAELEQYCVITHDPVSNKINDVFIAWFAEPNQVVSLTKVKRERLSAQERDEQPIIEEQEDPELVMDGKIDLGELVAQHLSLSLEPYPRVEGAEYENTQAGDKADEALYDNPFAALKDWKAAEKDKGKK